jgi:hypothetical protein
MKTLHIAKTKMDKLLATGELSVKGTWQGTRDTEDYLLWTGENIGDYRMVLGNFLEQKPEDTVRIFRAERILK